jgi:hypothetical protein
MFEQKNSITIKEIRKKVLLNHFLRGRYYQIAATMIFCLFV